MNTLNIHLVVRLRRNGLQLTNGYLNTSEINRFQSWKPRNLHVKNGIKRKVEKWHYR